MQLDGSKAQIWNPIGNQKIPVAQAFKDFLDSDGAALIEQIVPLGAPPR